MNSYLRGIIDQLKKEGKNDLLSSIAVTWIRYSSSNALPGKGIGTGLNEDRLLYPASIVKIFYAIAAEAWLQEDLIRESEELRRALEQMICESSNDATSLIIDLLTGTTSGPSLKNDRWEAWQKQRQLINEWLKSFNWSELKDINCCQKTWTDGPYGREKDFYGQGNSNRNALSTNATAKVLEEIMTENIVSPPACKRIKKLLSRSLDPAYRRKNPENQIDGFLGEGVPNGSQIWSKAGLMTQARHDSAWIIPPNSDPFLLVVFSQGRVNANDKELLPYLARELSKFELDQSST